MSQEEYKTLKEVFKDFYSNNKDLLSSTVKSVNLFKKTNTLEVELKVNTQIKIKDVYNFEKYLETRFGIKEACIKLVYEENNEKNEEGVCETNTQKENISEEVNQSHDEELTELDLVAAEQKNLQGILQDIQQKSKLVQNQISDIENSQLSEKDSGRKM